MAMFTAYFDESDSPSASVVAGLIGEASQLSHLNREWASLLKSEGLAYFHMKEFAHSTGEFLQGWKDNTKRRREFLQRVVGIISRRARISVGVIIDRSGYRKARPQSEIFSSFYVNEYTACSFMSLIRCANWADKWRTAEPIAYVFDDGNPKKKDFRRACDLAKRTSFPEEYHFGSLTFADDKQVLPLQAADFIAYELCKAYTDFDGNRRNVRMSLKQLTGRVPNDWRIGSEELLIKLAQKANQLP